MTVELNDGAASEDRVNHKRVARVMRAHQLAGIRLRRRVRTTVPEPADEKFGDLLQRDFTAEKPNQRYVGDITYLPLAGGGNLYLATVIDCYSRKLAGWAVADHMRTELVEDALKAACAQRGSLRGAIFHSDHGSVGGFNWSSQHLDLEGVGDGQGSLVDEDQRCAGGVAAAVAGGQGVTASDVVAGPTSALSDGPAGVLAGDRHGCHNSGSGDRGRRVGSCRVALVSSRWRHAADQSGRAEWPLPVLRRA